MVRFLRLVTYAQSNEQMRKLQDVSYTFKIDNSIAGVLNTPDIDTAGGYLSTIKYDYKYDGLNRLVKAAGLYTKAALPNSTTQETLKRFETGFSYSPNGNMTGKNIFDPESHGLQDSLVYTYGANNHAVTSITSQITAEEKYAMQYDACGNMISQIPPNPPEGGSPLNPPGGDLRAKSMQYDSYNRIKSVTNTNTSEVVGQYWYDDQGFRVRKLAKRVVGSETRQVEVLYPSMYFGLEKQRDSAGAEVPNSVYSVNNIYLDGVRIAAVIPSGDARYYLTDQVDSVKVVADDNGLAVSRMEYMPYGETWFEEGDTNNAPKYNSQELDRESNFYYYNARHYSQEVARFVTADTVIDGEFDTQGWNRYAYCKNNPIRYKDPTGHNQQSAVVDPEDDGISKKDDKVSAGAKESTKPTITKEENDATIKKLDNILNKGKADTDRINLNKGWHIVMLENNFNKSQYTPGKDEFKGEYFIIKDGDILKKGLGTSKASITPKSDSGEDYDTAVNKGKDLVPGNYKLKGDLKKGQLELYENEEKMKAKDRKMPSVFGKDKQRNLLIHDASGSGNWSGGIGCQVLTTFKSWAQGYSKNNESNITGDYHLVDMKAIRKEE